MSESALDLAALKTFYRDTLVENCLPFWLEHVADEEYGGYHTCIDRDGSVYDYDKLCMWGHGRIIWTYSYLYNEFDPRPEWLELARFGLEFVRKHGFAPDGSMYYSLARDGQPLVPSQDIYVDLFTVSGFSEYARATGDDALYEEARRILMDVWERLKEPGRAFQPFISDTRPVRIHGHSMITMNVIQGLRRYREEAEYDRMIDECVENIVSLHMRPERKAILEAVSWEGETIPGTTGRWVCPGHMIEAGIFFIHEGQHRNDGELVRTGVDFIDWGFEWGWDKKYGGIYNDVDMEGLPVGSYEGGAVIYPMKLWWQHTEALYGLLLAYAMTGEAKFAHAYRKTHDYSFTRFADDEYGEWFALLDRRGNRLTEEKGNSRKSPFHLARNCYWAYRLLERMTR